MKTLKTALAVASVSVAAVFAFATPAMAGGHHDGNGNGGHHDGNGGGNGGQHSSNNWGALNGNQLDIDPDLGVNVCGISLAILGFANSNADCVNYFD